MSEINEKIKCFELDFEDDTNLISENIEDIITWIKSDMNDLVQSKEGEDVDPLNYKISIKMMTQKELEDLPDWA